MKNGEQTAFPTGADNPNYQGLTKREYFAAMAMQGILASPIISVQTMTDKDKALYGIVMADHLLEMLEKS